MIFNILYLSLYKIKYIEENNDIFNRKWTYGKRLYF